MGINFSRLLTLKYGNSIQNYLKDGWKSINVGRVMTCVLGMICNREREIRGFEKTPFYRVMAQTDIAGRIIDTEWKAVKGSKFFESPLLYKENGFKEKTTAVALIEALEKHGPMKLENSDLANELNVKPPYPLEMTIKSINEG